FKVKAEKFSNFEEFKRNYLKSFKNYERNLNEEFEEYKRVVNEEFNRYKKLIKAEWGKAEVSDFKKWVEYSKDFKVRKIVNFKTGEVKISVIAKNRKQAKEEILAALTDLLTENLRTAFKRDILDRRIEKRLKRLHINFVTGKPSSEPIITFLYFKTYPKNKKVVIKKAKVLFSKAQKEVKLYKKKKIFTIKFKLPPNYLVKKAKEYLPTVRKIAKKRRLSEALILAIIHTESWFNPLARSPIPAYGLMQVVPQTAGKDATKFLYGQPLVLSPSFLYNPYNNVLVGTTYFYLLYYEYLKQVKDPRIRLYCAIAAYNGGIGRVLFVLTTTKDLNLAAKKLNRLSPEEVYAILTSYRMPKETREYLKKVLKRERLYEQFLRKNNGEV
ncbi:MAG: DUF3393 domain-containing protein, partial [Thermodesulfobacteria bacterium]|nr:DUF3393 domain-containing protein [Thermodesulfobacteriota bacterium]